MKTIRSDCHQISSYEINKISLSPFDDKRYILSDGISSYAYGHLNINGYKDYGLIIFLIGITFLIVYQKMKRQSLNLIIKSITENLGLLSEL